MIWFRGRKNCQRISENRRIKRSRESGFSLTRYLLWCVYLACDANVNSKVVARKNLSSAVLGGEGLFNLSLQGNGIAALESNVPEDELIEVILENDELKIDGNLAVCWSSNLEFTVERSTKTLVGSAVSGEGLVNVYRGTGRVESVSSFV